MQIRKLPASLIGGTFPAKPKLTPPTTPVELIEQFDKAILKWGSAGFPVVDKATFEDRRAICGSCEFWDPRGNLGLGKCKACGCTKVKWWLATEACVEGKWGAKYKHV